MARANRLAVAAAVLAVEDAELMDASLTDAGICMGVGLEPADLKDILPPAHRSHTNGVFSLERLVDEGIGWMNPLSSLKTLPNMSIAHVAIRLGLQGPAWALCADASAGHDALFEGAQLIRTGRASIVLAGAADSKTSFADRLSAARNGQLTPVGEAAVFLVLESREAAESRGTQIYCTLESHHGEPRRSKPFGNCGAATTAVAYALEVAQHGKRVNPKKPERAPAVHVRKKQSPIAITGIGLATPLGNRFETYAENLIAGVSAVGPIQAFNAQNFPVKNACESTLPNLDDMDGPFELKRALSGISDRKSEFALYAALSAISNYGESLGENVGFLYGTGLSSISPRELEEDFFPFFDDEGNFDYDALARTSRHAHHQSPRRHEVGRIAQEIASTHGFTGPVSSHFSACAAGAAAIGHGMDLLRQGRVSKALAGGADSMVHPYGMVPFILLGATSREHDPSRAGRPFDKDRDGFVMGEGGVFFVLESLDDARLSGRDIMGVLLGWGSSCDAHNVTAPHPEGAGARRAMERAIDDAGLEKQRIGYVNAHGTGTALNDVVEAKAIGDLFGAHRPAVSSSKGQIGHAIAAAGALEMVSCLAAFKQGALPPNAHLETPDPNIEIDLVGVESRYQETEVILSNSFGFGGQNVSLVIGHPEGDW